MQSSGDVWTIKRAQAWIEEYLGAKGDEHPRVSAQWLLCWACNISKLELYADFQRPLSAEERTRLREGVVRRGAGEPLQYISGESPFRYLNLKIAKGVLIPRPETEVLVSEILSFLRSEQKTCEEKAWERFVDEIKTHWKHTEERVTAQVEKSDSIEALVHGGDDELPAGADGWVISGFEAPTIEPLVIDVCTGSGCVALAVATEFPSSRVLATDIAAEALVLARENTERCQVEDRVKVLESDLLSAVPERFWGTVDAVVSNPPYIPDALLNDIPSEVREYEPRLALAGGADGLEVFRRLVPQAHNMLREGGFFAVELHEESMDEARHVLEDAGFCAVRVVYDLAGKPRIVAGLKSA